MRVMVWHVHGGWMDAFVRGDHEYLIPTMENHDATGLGAGGRSWPASVRELTPGQLAEAEVDVVVLQRLEELEASEKLLGRRLGRDLPALFVEHNAPRGDVPNSRHPLADRDDLTIVHVTHFNRLMWDCGSTHTTVIEHGVPDPGELYRGDAATLGVVINEPVRRWRVTGSDLIAQFAAVAPVELFGMKTELLVGRLGLARDRLVVRGDLPTDELHARLSGCRAYLHPVRWTSLGLALLEAMHLGMPVVALATTEAYRAVPPEAGFLSTDLDELIAGVRILMNDPAEAAARGRAARLFALAHFGLDAFLSRWTTALDDAVSRSLRPSATAMTAMERTR
ncbi:MAG: hypothetical protein QOI70_647 [Microbacteriaceae bacterium]|nr:hypothetical protein [Microbacteriaceae bacterium]